MRFSSPKSFAPSVPHRGAWLLSILVLAAVCLVSLALFGGAPPGSVYRPARLIDGKIVPDQFGK